MKRLIAAILCTLLFLTGCALGKTEILPSLQPSKAPEAETVQEIPDLPAETETIQETEAPTEAAPTLADAVKETVTGFTSAYFRNDTESMYRYLSSDFDGDFDLCPDLQAELVEYLGLETAAQTLEEKGSCELSLPFRAKPEDDFYTYLSMGLVSEGDEVKISWYGLEG